MSRGAALLPALALVLTLAPAGAATGADWSGYVGIEGRAFPSGRGEGGQPAESLSLVLTPELHWNWDGGDQSVRFTPFLRLDQHDGERTHFDVRELFWQWAALGWELSAGVRRLFWGVTESQHLVDFLNQTDLVEDPEGEAKLGQPMVQLSLIRPWGVFDFFLLIGFRERTFPGPDGRLRPAPVAVDRAAYESAAGKEHLDAALRWSHSAGPFDLGLAHFAGTDRQPRLLPDPTGTGELIPYYEQIDRTSLDLQATLGPCLWKLEAIAQRGSSERFAAFTAGLEYTFFDIRRSGIDVGLLSEFLYDDRGGRATTPFQDDLFVGARLALNDFRGTEMLLGAIVDRQSGASFFNLEASRRLNRNLKLSLAVRAFTGAPEGDPLSAFRRDDYVQVLVARYL